VRKRRSSSRSKSSSATRNRERKPVVFMFQPTRFVRVRPQKLRQWENGLRAAIGENAPVLRKLLDTRGFETTSICRPGGADDCDWHDEDPIV
jgi:hypothetical protein